VSTPAVVPLKVAPAGLVTSADHVPVVGVPVKVALLPAQTVWFIPASVFAVTITFTVSVSPLQLPVLPQTLYIKESVVVKFGAVAEILPVPLAGAGGVGLINAQFIVVLPTLEVKLIVYGLPEHTVWLHALGVIIGFGLTVIVVVAVSETQPSKLEIHAL